MNKELFVELNGKLVPIIEVTLEQYNRLPDEMKVMEGVVFLVIDIDK